MRDVNCKILRDKEELVKVCRMLKEGDLKIVLTTGIYDLLHAGHLMYLISARIQGDVLIVGVNSDEHTKQIKGENRPIIQEEQRAFMVAGFECVDYVYIFENRIELVEIVIPAVFVMSETSHAKPNQGERLVQQQIVQDSGGEVVIFGSMQTCSTTEIISRIKSS
jgi:rfaE bifunctional protein nucleotidyltransferase chain/domain